MSQAGASSHHCSHGFPLTVVAPVGERKNSSSNYIQNDETVAHCSNSSSGIIKKSNVSPPPSSSLMHQLTFDRNSIDDDVNMTVMKPKASNCAQASTLRRSTRLAKASVKKASLPIKHKLHDSQSVVRISRVAPNDEQHWDSSTIEESNPQGHVNGDSEVSPLCVKKKMRRRAIQFPITKKNISTIYSPNSRKKLATTIKNITYPQVPLHKRNVATMPPDATKSSHWIDETVPMVLFEECEDFWTEYLLKTYQQITSSTPDQQDFEPIPYSLLARGVPVHVDEISDKKVTSWEGVPVNTEPIASVAANKKNLSRRVLEEDFLTASKGSSRTDGSIDNEPIEKSRWSKSAIGPESWQMNVIKGMIKYLDEAKDGPYSKYSTQFHEVTKICTKLHNERNNKFRHLPGAIFEEIVGLIGGEAFLEIYKNATKTFSPTRRISKAVVVKPTSGKIDEATSLPSVLQVAVGYGFYMAQSFAPEGPNSNWDRATIKSAAENGVQTVLNMSDKDRLKFWTELGRTE
jgi:hypothetical protein